MARSRGRVLAAAVVAVTLALALAACDAGVQTTPATSDAPGPGEPGAWSKADLVVVVTANELDSLVGIDVAGHRLTAPTPIDKNEEKPHMDGGMVSVPPWSVVLTPAKATPLLWTVASGAGAVVVRELERSTGEVRPVAGPARGMLPFLYDGNLAWASEPGDGLPRIQLGDGIAFNVPKVPTFVAAGPGPGRISAVIELGNVDVGERNERILIVDVAADTTTWLPTERLHFGGLWADDSILAASVFSRIVPTIEDPQNGEPDNRILTWSIDAGANPDAVAGLVEGPALRSNTYPELVAAGDGLLAVVTGNFDHPKVEVHSLDEKDPARLFVLPEAGYVTALAFVGGTLVVLDSRHVTFIDLATDAVETVDLGGATGTVWVGP